MTKPKPEPAVSRHFRRWINDDLGLESLIVALPSTVVKVDDHDGDGKFVFWNTKSIWKKWPSDRRPYRRARVLEQIRRGDHFPTHSDQEEDPCKCHHQPGKSSKSWLIRIPPITGLLTNGNLRQEHGPDSRRCDIFEGNGVNCFSRRHLQCSECAEAE